MIKKLGITFVRSCAMAILCLPASAATISAVTDPTTNWTAVPLISLDPSADQQTGQADADLVGIAANPGFYTAYDGTNIYFRARLGKAPTGGAFTGLLWVGIDGNGDGALDIFIGVNNQGSTKQVGFYDAGTGANNSPSTTSIGNAVAAYQITETATNYNYQAVSSTIDPTSTNLDLNADGKTDMFLSILVPFFGASGSASLQGALAGLAGISIDQNTRLAYVLATSTQANSINQDIGGLNGSTNSTITYKQLGAISPPITGTGTVVPEPGSTTYLGVAAALLFAGKYSGRLRRKSTAPQL